MCGSDAQIQLYLCKGTTQKTPGAFTQYTTMEWLRLVGSFEKSWVSFARFLDPTNRSHPIPCYSLLHLQCHFVFLKSKSMIQVAFATVR